MKQKFNPIIYPNEDGMTVMKVGPWAQKKHKLVGRYCDIFTTAMRKKWNLIYLDLFSGPGYVRNKDSNALMMNSALIAMSTPYKFDHYILNDYNEENVLALTRRVNHHHPTLSVKIYNEDANACIEKVLQERPIFNNDKGTLTFCFLDPFSLNLNFDIVRSLSSDQTDILVLHALQMDGKRNLKYYYEVKNQRIADFTGTLDWREKFTTNGYAKCDFIKFISDEFDKNIKALGYKSATEKEMIQNTSGMGIYYLAFYSKHDRGIEFFEKIRKGPNNQLELF